MLRSKAVRDLQAPASDGESWAGKVLCSVFHRMLLIAVRTVCFLLLCHQLLPSWFFGERTASCCRRVNLETGRHGS